MKNKVHSKLIKWISDPTICTLKIINSTQAAKINKWIKKLEAYIQEDTFTTIDIKKRKRALDM